MQDNLHRYLQIFIQGKLKGTKEIFIRVFLLQEFRAMSVINY